MAINLLMVLGVMILITFISIGICLMFPRKRFGRKRKLLKIHPVQGIVRERKALSSVVINRITYPDIK